MGKTKKKNQPSNRDIPADTSWKDDDAVLHGLSLIQRVQVQVRSYEKQDRHKCLRPEDRVHMLALKKELKTLQRRDGASFTGHRTERTHTADADESFVY